MATIKKPININRRDFQCEDCGKVFAHKSSKSRHQKSRCPQKSYTNHNISTTSYINTNNNNNNNDDDNFEQSLVASKSYGEELLQIIQKQNKQIQHLTQIVEEKVTKDSNVTIENQHNIQNNISIFITDKVDFVTILTERFGEEAKAIQYLKEKIYQSVDGDISLFSDIYLNGPVESWPFICQDPKNAHFLIKDQNNKMIDDPGGVKLHKNFKKNYTDTLLRLSSQELNNVIDCKVGTVYFESKRDNLLDNFDLRSVQNKVYNLCKDDHKPFIKKLLVKIAIIKSS